MQSNLDYLATSQFGGVQDAIERSDREWKARTQVSLDKMIQEVMGTKTIGLGEIIEHASNLPDADGFFYGTEESEMGPATVGLIAELEELRAVYGSNSDQWDRFSNRVDKFLSGLDQSQSEKMKDRTDAWAELEPESNDWSDPETDIEYMEGRYIEDVKADVEDRSRWSETLNDWVYAPSGLEAPKMTVGQKAWGFYNEAATTDYQNSLVRLMYRGNSLYIGAVSINLAAGKARCNVSGCKYTLDLSSDPHQTGEFDRVAAEYQTLLILAHLGEHTRRNPANYWNVIDRVNESRDNDYQKLDSASNLQSLLGDSVSVALGV